jgi:hypothetical protein
MFWWSSFHSIAFGTTGDDATRVVPHPDRNKLTNTVKIESIILSLLADARVDLMTKDTRFTMPLPIAAEIH